MKKRGFTLIEVIVALGIIVVLVTITLPSLTKIRQASRDGKRKADLHQVRSALEGYRGDAAVPHYPYADSYANYASLLVPAYLNQMPNDPLEPARQYSIAVADCSADGTLPGGYNCPRYFVCAALEAENPGAPSECLNPDQCGAGVLCNYAIGSP